MLARENPPSFFTLCRFYWLKKIMPNKGAMHQMGKCSTLSQTREEDLAEETKVDSNKVDMVSQSENTPPIIDKRPGMHWGSSVEGGAILLNQAAKTARLNANTVENLVTMKRGVERRNVNRHRPLTNYAMNSNYDDHGRMFVMRRKVHSMLAPSPTNTPALENVWFSDSGEKNQWYSS